MRFFDLVNFSDASIESVGKRLGYKKIFLAGKDVGILEGATLSKGRYIIRSDSLEAVKKALRQNSVIGMLPKNLSASQKALAMVKENDKLLFIPLSEVTCADAASRVQALARARKLVRGALMAKTLMALVSMAESREGMMSSLQMLEVAGFLGMDAERAKAALGRLGGLV